MNNTDFKYVVDVENISRHLYYKNEEIPLLIKINYLSLHQHVDKEIFITKDELLEHLKQLIEEDETIIYSKNKIEFYLNCFVTEEIINYLTFCLRYLFLIPIRYSI